MPRVYRAIHARLVSACAIAVPPALAEPRSAVEAAPFAVARAPDWSYIVGTHTQNGAAPHELASAFARPVDAVAFAHAETCGLAQAVVSHPSLLHALFLRALLRPPLSQLELGHCSEWEHPFPELVGAPPMRVRCEDGRRLRRRRPGVAT